MQSQYGKQYKISLIFLLIPHFSVDSVEMATGFNLELELKETFHLLLHSSLAEMLRAVPGQRQETGTLTLVFKMGGWNPSTWVFCLLGTVARRKINDKLDSQVALAFKNF